MKLSKADFESLAVQKIFGGDSSILYVKSHRHTEWDFWTQAHQIWRQERMSYLDLIY